MECGFELVTCLFEIRDLASPDHPTPFGHVGERAGSSGGSNCAVRSRCPSRCPPTIVEAVKDYKGRVAGQFHGWGLTVGQGEDGPILPEVDELLLEGKVGYREVRPAVRRAVDDDGANPSDERARRVGVEARF